MYAEERQQLILGRARANGRVDVAGLADELEVTSETIRRDLGALERQGVLRRVHGGAIPIERLGFEPGVAERSGVMVAEKERIAKAALAELPEDGSILLDAGTTTAALAALLPTGRDLRVVTNSLPIAASLAGRRGLTLMIVGGRVRGRTLAAVGEWAVSAIADMYVDVAFMATNGVTVERGLSTPDPTEAATKKVMIGAARRAVLLADHTKVGIDSFATFAPISAIDTFVVDSGIDADVAAEFEAAGPRVVRA